MIIFGLVLMVIGWVLGFSLLVTIGVVLLVVGLALMLMGSMGRGVRGRSHFW